MVTYVEYLEEINKRYTPYPTKNREMLAVNAEIVQACIGLSTEVGEVQDLLLKSWMYGRQLDQEALTLELGDVLHYLMRVADLNYISFPVLMERNLDKLSKRDHFAGEKK